MVVGTIERDLIFDNFYGMNNTTRVGTQARDTNQFAMTERQAVDIMNERYLIDRTTRNPYQHLSPP
jgi:hypothetical protein